MFRYISIGNNSFIPTYNLLIGIGIALAMLYLQYQYEFKIKSENEKFKIHLSLLIATIGGFIGAFLLDAYTQNITIKLENLNKIGLTFFGGFIVGSILLLLLLKLFSFPILKTLNELTPSFCIAHFFGRIGCFMAGCCFGLPTNTIFGVTFPINSLPYNHYQHLLKIHPTQLYESFFVGCMFFSFLLFKTKNKFLIYIIFYSIFRFIIEFIRADNRGIIANQSTLTPSQLISLTIGLGSLVILTKQFIKIKTIKI
jgi:phosphatidylglycerol:prolipoprotein diacylglycerol transferase